MTRSGGGLRSGALNLRCEGDLRVLRVVFHVAGICEL